MHNVYKSLACLLLIPVQNFFQNQHLAEFQDPSIKRRAITNGIICRPRIRLESYLRSTAYFSFGPPSLVIVQTEINTPRSLGACSHLRNCIPTRHIVKLSFSLFLPPSRVRREEGVKGVKAKRKVTRTCATSTHECAPKGPPYPRLGKRKRRKKGKKGKGWSLERERERESSLKRGTVGFRATGRNKKESFRPRWEIRFRSRGPFCNSYRVSRREPA